MNVSSKKRTYEVLSAKQGVSLNLPSARLFFLGGGLLMQAPIVLEIGAIPDAELITLKFP